MTQSKYTLEHCIYSDSLLNKLEELNITAIEYKCDQVNIPYIKKGLSFAKHYHNGQFRKSGEPYVSHPIAVAIMVANEKFKEDVIIAALLHDTIEDTTLTLSEIKAEFSPRIAQMVDMLTRDRPEGTKLSVEEILSNAYEKKDEEVILIKIIDRIHNITTIGVKPLEKQIKEASETLEHFIALLFYLNLPEENLVKLCISLIQQKTNYKPVCFSYLNCTKSDAFQILVPNFQNDIDQIYNQQLQVS